MSTEISLFNISITIIGLLGIGMAVWGFFWIKRYGKKPNLKQRDEWDKEHGEVSFSDRIGGELDITFEEKTRNEDDSASAKFIKHWKRKKMHSLILVIVDILLPSVSIILGFLENIIK